MNLRTPSWTVAVGAVGALAMLVTACGESSQPLGSSNDPKPPGDGPAALPESPSASPAVIFVVDADGSNARRLAEGQRPSWSPDGDRVAFQRGAEIHVIEADGSGEVSLAAGRDPAWSPDGALIAFAGDEGIAIVTADGSGTPTLIQPDYRDSMPVADSEELRVGMPAWSPDGQRIAFSRTIDWEDMGAFTQVYVMDADGSDAHRLTPTAGAQSAECHPSWSPDGSRIALWHFETGIAVVKATGGFPTSVFGGFPAFCSSKPAWSPDGGSLSFTRFEEQVPSIWIVGSDGGSAQELLRGGRHASWSPDGSRMAVVGGST